MIVVHEASKLWFSHQDFPIPTVLLGTETSLFRNQGRDRDGERLSTTLLVGPIRYLRDLLW